MRLARIVARAIAWVFVAAIAYHGVLAVTQAVRAADHKNWSYAAELGAIALVTTLVVVAALVAAVRSFTRARSTPTPYNARSPEKGAG